MIDAKMSFAQVEVAQIEGVSAKPARRMAPLLGLGLAAVVSAGLWAGLAMTVARIF